VAASFTRGAALSCIAFLVKLSANVTADMQQSPGRLSDERR
jgi:hypothetical protein